MKTSAAVAWEAGRPLTVEIVDLEGPKAGEVLVEIKATGICHTDLYTLSGADPEGLFPAILGHEGAGVVVDVGPGVTSLRRDDHVIPLYTPECRQCSFCLSRKTNLCQSIRGTQGRGLMPDATSRFSLGGKPLLHYMGTSTFSNYIVVPEIALAKIRSDAPFDTVCYIGCGVTTGVGAVLFTAKVGSALVRVLPTVPTLVAGSLALGAVAVGIHHAMAIRATQEFALLCAVLGFTWLFLMPFQMALAFRCDVSGRVASLIPAMQVFGIAFGPLIGSLVIRGDDASRLPAVSIGFAIAATVALVVSGRNASRSRATV